MDHKKILLGVCALVIIGVLVVAQTGNSDLVTGMIGCKMSKTTGSGIMLCFVVIKLVAIAVVSLIFSVIFCYTYKVIVKPKK